MNIKMIRPLIDREYERLIWNGVFTYDGMVRIRTELDGSCMFHAIAKSYCKSYIEGRIGEISIDRGEFVRKLRKDLANMLGETIENSDKTYYENLSGGQLLELSKHVPEYSLEYMKKILDSNQPVGNAYNEFISNVINKDIYLIDYSRKDVYMTGDNYDLLHKGRPSIVLLVIPGHYELIGVIENEKIKTLFEHDHPFIKHIKLRIKHLLK